MKRLALVSLAIATLACNRGSGPSGSPPQAAEDAKKLAQNAAPAAPAPSLDPKDLITDDKVGRYIVYQTEMNTVSDLVMGASVQAFDKSKGSQKGFEKELSKDERTKKIADTTASALAKSGLTMAEVPKLAEIIIPYTAGATVGDDDMKKKARDEFSAKYGPAALAVLEKRRPDLERLQDEMIKSMTRKK